MHREPIGNAWTPLRIPPSAGSAPRLRLTAWFASVGEMIAAGEAVCEVGLSGIVMTVHAPVSGRLTARNVEIGESLEPRAVLGWIAATETVRPGVRDGAPR